jgi:ribonuclease G
MSEDILVNITPRETRVAVVDNGILQEIYIERESRLGLVGNIYKGRVERVMPGMQAAFIEIGLERTAFLHEDDLTISEPKKLINSTLSEGQEVIVQVVKDPFSSKGARLTMHLSISSRSLVMIPDANNVSVSLKIIDPAERERLKQLLMSGAACSPHGFIIRTAAEGAIELEKDKLYLLKQWDKIFALTAKVKCGDLIHQELRLALRTFRDIVTINTESVKIDNPAQFEQIKEFISEFASDFQGKIEIYTDNRPLFDFYGINDEIAKALQRRTSLKSGGYLIIDQNEAMSTIDVNTGAFVGHRNLEETVYKTNLEAASVIARQIRLRNLAGIIIIDFIDMHDQEHRSKVLRVLEKELTRDPIKTIISDFSALSLVQMTRKRTRESLQHCLCEPCSSCSGRGYISSVETISFEIFREINRSVNAFPAESLLIIAAPVVINFLMEEEAKTLTDLEHLWHKKIKLQSEPLYQQEQYDMVLL